MKQVVDLISSEGGDYIEFMIHSSELMPGGSPNFSDEYSIECLYNDMEELFDYIVGKGYVGSTFKEYLNIER
jgi:hypothetical protein